MNVTPTPTSRIPVCQVIYIQERIQGVLFEAGMIPAILSIGKPSPGSQHWSEAESGFKLRFVCLQSQRTSHSRGGLVAPRGDCGVHVAVFLSNSSKTISLENSRGFWACSVKNLPRQKKWTVSFPKRIPKWPIKHTKRHSSALLIRGMQIETTVRCHWKGWNEKGRQCQALKRIWNNQELMPLVGV